jgi:hypothetical protein
VFGSDYVANSCVANLVGLVRVVRDRVLAAAYGAEVVLARPQLFLLPFFLSKQLWGSNCALKMNTNEILLFLFFNFSLLR